MAITQDEVIQILKLIEEAPFGQVNLEMGGLKLEVRKGNGVFETHEGIKGLPSEPIIIVKSPSETEAVAGSQTSPKDIVIPEVEEGVLIVTAPILGTFYRFSEPGAPPYVEEGSLVDKDSTVGLIEVMKMFNPVKAGVSGRIQRICIDNGQLVEYGQPLFLVKPDDGLGAQDA